MRNFFLKLVDAVCYSTQTMEGEGVGMGLEKECPSFLLAIS